jgi:glycosyltransferase involved in cell wall biosynthesis
LGLSHTLKVCLLTTGQLSTDPRLLKEADALDEAGYHVTVLAAHWTEWATETDAAILSKRSWECRYVGGSPRDKRLLYEWTRLRHRLSGRLLAHLFPWRIVRHRALARVLPELRRTAQRIKADLYVAHNLGALPAAVKGARRNGAMVGFDAEDFHSGMRPLDSEPSAMDRAIEDLEGTFLPQCHFVTAGSAGIAEAYERKYGMRRPVPVLNVFPLAMRAPTFRPTTRSGPLTLYWFSQTIGSDRGLEDVLAAMALLPDRGVELHIRGVWQPGYENRIRDQASSLGLTSEQLIWYPPGPPDEMVRLACHFDVGLALEQGASENRQICLTNKIFTYLLAGCAVVATATRGQEPIMQQIGSAGALYKPGDTQELAGVLQLWSGDRSALDRARHEAWDWGTYRYNWDIEKERFLEIVSRALTPATSRLAKSELRTRHAATRRQADSA